VFIITKYINYQLVKVIKLNAKCISCSRRVCDGLRVYVVTHRRHI